MALTLRSLATFDVDMQRTIINIYAASFNADFRIRMNEEIVGIDWNSLNNATLKSKLSLKLRSQYSNTGKQQDADFCKQIMNSLGEYTTHFMVCAQKEEALYKVGKKRSRHVLYSGTSTASTSAAATSNKQPHVMSPAVNMPVPSPVSPASTLVQTPKPIPNAGDQLIYELISHQQSLMEFQSLVGTYDQNSFLRWSTTAYKMDEIANIILVRVSDLLHRWDKHKRRLANEFEHNDERYDIRHEQFNREAFRKVEAVYLDEINGVENEAQTAVLCLYDLMDTATGWRNFYPQDALFIEMQARNLIEKFVQATFIVWRQSEQVIKAGNKFKATVRLLVGPVLRLDPGDRSVLVKMLTSKEIFKNDGNANSVSGNNGNIQVSSDPIHAQFQIIARPKEYDVTAMRTGPAGRRILQPHARVDHGQQQSMVIEFPDITWFSKDKRAAKKENELTVCELKYAAVFQGSLNLHGHAVPLRCISMPLILIVHASQECKAHGTIFWDNAFSKTVRELFAVPEEVTWNKFGKRFVEWFASQTQAPWSTLTMEGHNMLFIRDCLARLNAQGQPTVSLSRFYRDKLSEPIKFVFCDWIYGVCKLICEDAFLKFLWQRGAVYGFATHDSGLRELQRCGNSAMLLRFGTTPVLNKKGQPQVGLVIMVTDLFRIISLKPATLEDLKGVADLRKHMMAASVTRDYLHPNNVEWKSTLLRKFEEANGLVAQEEDSNDHYIRIDIGITIDDRKALSEQIFLPDTDSVLPPVDFENNLSNSFAELLTFSTFSEIQSCSVEPELSNIQVSNLRR